MNPVRDFLSNRAERCVETIASVPGPRDFAERKDVSYKEVFEWDSQGGHLSLSATKESGSTDYKRELNIVLGSGRAIQSLRYTTSTLDYDGDRPAEPKQHQSFEGNLADLGIFKLGKAAFLLFQTAGAAKKKQ